MSHDRLFLTGIYMGRTKTNRKNEKQAKRGNYEGRNL
jgi:hypothetical protein